MSAEIVTPDRVACRQRCGNEYGSLEGSYLCYSYCQDFPKDPACPANAATRIAAIKARTFRPTSSPTHQPTVSCRIIQQFSLTVGFCDRTLCSPFLWRDSVLATDTPGLATCRDVCASLSLGPEGTNGTKAIRQQCQAQCASDGYNSYVCQVRAEEAFGHVGSGFGQAGARYD